MKVEVRMFLNVKKDIEVTNSDSVDFAEEKIIEAIKKDCGEDFVSVDLFEIKDVNKDEKFIKKYNNWTLEVKR